MFVQCTGQRLSYSDCTGQFYCIGLLSLLDNTYLSYKNCTGQFYMLAQGTGQHLSNMDWTG